jgi:hypothetical protein
MHFQVSHPCVRVLEGTAVQGLGKCLANVTFPAAMLKWSESGLIRQKRPTNRPLSRVRRSITAV